MTARILEIDLQVRDYIIKHKHEHCGDSPTLREIGEAIGRTSTSYISSILHKLDNAGLIQWDGRNIAVPGMVCVFADQVEPEELRY